MSVFDQNGFYLPDLSGLTESMKRIHEISKACAESMKRLHEIGEACSESMRKAFSSIQPMLEHIHQIRNGLIEYSSKVAKASRVIAVSIKLGEAQYVQWDYMSQGS